MRVPLITEDLTRIETVVEISKEEDVTRRVQQVWHLIFSRRVPAPDLSPRRGLKRVGCFRHGAFKLSEHFVSGVEKRRVDVLDDGERARRSQLTVSPRAVEDFWHHVVASLKKLWFFVRGEVTRHESDRLSVVQFDVHDYSPFVSDEISQTRRL